MIFATPLRIAYTVAGAAIVAGLLWARHEWNAGQAAIREARELRAQVAALTESAQLVGGVLAETETKVLASTDKAAKVRIIYRDAVRTDPTCAEWARQPIACPIGGTQ